mmetsp:Transcript_32283/g.101422  ORF Transcript_32283/g.101422 Transcript_32283/m.101422 type:complete len:386 (-) Transcript_32283:251-1408(-)
MSEPKEIAPTEPPQSATITAKDRDDSVASEMDGRDSRIAELEKAPMLDPEKGRMEKTDTSSPETPAAAKKEEKNKAADAAAFAFCFFGLQVSYLTWGFVQEKVMTKEYTTGKFPSATFCVFSNRVLAIVVAMAAMCIQHRSLKIPAPFYAFAPCSISNTLSSYGQYEALHYVSFGLQTLSKSTKVIPVMLMGKLLNKKSYKWIEYVEAIMISFGVSLFSFSEKSAPGDDKTTELLGYAMIALYIGADSFTSQWQTKVYKAHPGVDQFQMMFGVNTWSILFTLAALLASGELWTTIAFLKLNPAALMDNVTIAITSATGQLFIFYTIKRFGPVAFTIIMTTRQIFSMVISNFAFGHSLGISGWAAASIVFATLFYRVYRSAKSRKG